MMRRLPSVAGVFLLLVACSSNTATTDSASTPPSVVSASAAPAAVSTKEIFSRADGVEVQVAGVTEATLPLFPSTEDESAKAGDPYIVVSIRYRNGSTKELELLPTVILKYGQDRQTAAEVATEGEFARVNLAPGATTSQDFGLIVPEEYRDDVTLEVAIDAGTKAMFQGRL
jgi:hypothetical protein